MALEQQGQVGSKAVGGNNVKYDPEGEHRTIAYILCLSKADVVVLSVHQVILIESRVLR